MDDGRRGRRPRLNLQGTCSSGGSHVVSFVWRPAAPARGCATRPGRERRVRGRAGAILPGVENRPPSPASGRRRRLAGDERGAPPAHLPAPGRRGKSILRAYAGVSVLSGRPSRPPRGGERGCARADAWLPPPPGGGGGRGLGAAGRAPRGPRGSRPAPGMLARRLPPRTWTPFP